MKIAFFSTMTGMPWGGSEELWSRAASALFARGHEVCVSYRRRPQTPAKLLGLESEGAKVQLRSGFHWGRSVRRMLERLGVGNRALKKWLHQTRPNFVVVSLGYHTDDPTITAACRDLGIPYAMLLQAASPHVWFERKQWQPQYDAYAGAAQCFFVSPMNRDVIEANLALDMSAARIVDNPFNVPLDASPAWPVVQGDRWKLACVARLHFQSKGQDVLLHVLRQPKWRARPLEVTLWGEDAGNRAQIEKLIRLYGLQSQVKLGGYVDDVQDVRRTHHALVLPSRFEGNALAMIEAMMCGRMPIVTNVGRVSELIDDGDCGFVAPAATVELVDDALERAWRQRDEWQVMGARAAEAIRTRHSLAPAEDFADAILAAAAAVKVKRDAPASRTAEIDDRPVAHAA